MSHHKNQHLLDIEEAQEIVLSSMLPLPAERMTLLKALGCVLAEPVKAQVALPPFDNSAMDGYAVIAEDTQGASKEQPRLLKVIEDVPAGKVPARNVEDGQAARIMTGAPVPEGADAVVIVEHTRPTASGEVEILVPANPGDNIRPAGEDIRQGDLPLQPGQKLGPGELGLAAALGYTEIAATRRPRVAIITTGSELVEPGNPLPPGKIYNSNLTLLAARVLAANAEVVRSLHVADDEKAVEEALRKCQGADLFITAGGVSVGEYDFVKKVLSRLGEIKFWRVNMKPGKPVAFGAIFGRPLFGLPGNPISALVTFELLVAPALRKMAGQTECLPPTVQAVLLHEVSHKPGRREFRQARTITKGDHYEVEAAEKRGSAMLTSTTGANSLLIIPLDCTGLKAGEKVSVIFPAYKEPL